MLSKFLVAAALGLSAVAASTVSPNTPFNYGHAAYTYGPLHCTQDACDVVPSCNTAHFAPDIADYNSKSPDSADISIVYSYGGDIEFWPAPSQPTACWAPASEDRTSCNVSVFFDSNNIKAAEVYRAAEGVKSIVALLDSRMDGMEQIQAYNDFDACKFGDFYPNLNNLTDFAIERLAKDTAALYCATNVVSGIQVDLEPYREPYKAALEKFIAMLATTLRDESSTNGCRNDVYPKGRSISYFTFAHNHVPAFSQSLGANGYYVFSLYDLADQIWPEDPTFIPNSIETYKTRLRQEIDYVRPVVGNSTKFTIALPMAASCHEYEQYIPMKGNGCGPACTPHTSGVTMAQYVQAAFDVILSPEVTRATGGVFCLNETAASQFLGVSFWTWTYDMTYPPMKWFDNVFLPPTPPDDVLDVIRANLPKLSDGTTCVAVPPQPAGCSAALKPNGCNCNHSSDCSSNWCTGSCQIHPVSLATA